MWFVSECGRCYESTAYIFRHKFESFLNEIAVVIAGINIRTAISCKDNYLCICEITAVQRF